MAPIFKDIVTETINRAEGLVKKWPVSFLTIIDASKYVGTCLRWQCFRYGVLATTSTQANFQVKLQTCHIIAMRAWNAKKYTLKTPPVTSPALYSAVEAGIEQATAAIESFPKSFKHINCARDYIRNVCCGKRLVYPFVEGILPIQVALYVHYSTARQAYEAGKFDLECKPYSTSPSHYTAKGANSQACPAIIAKEPSSQPIVPAAPQESIKDSDEESDESLEELLGIPFTSAASKGSKNDTKVEGQVQLIALEDLIDLESPESKPVLCQDIVDLIDIGEYRVQNQACNEPILAVEAE
ncbi:hypothetical protein P280DRAFT_475566 [Massarina eburnea CBS 473.64]|uniref:Uncharacterized protein n=1 Tax=Massarina eburnea CBS 473.64 TaxID=1395130 RepID=A0A6A6SI98_9PLEO|nr:hypothetical protein P280DRAFT_475566 [Massarina eburnea CBS 473.64]